jgi:hypothetical protein|tara:strand:+ start:651 stop:758 length:108 start_codon:yes stop_codon:yes gene_type:complete
MLESIEINEELNPNRTYGEISREKKYYFNKPKSSL